MSISSLDEEDARKSSDVLPFFIRHFNIGPEMARAVERILCGIEARDINITLLVATAVVLAKCGERIDMRFSMLCNDVIGDIVDTDPNISGSKFYDKTTIKKNILRRSYEIEDMYLMTELLSPMKGWADMQDKRIAK
uniref:Predicted protein n=1 Tax=Physcomitrium patens TaxID=3218 RepID=A9U4W3_PHYPA